MSLLGPDADDVSAVAQGVLAKVREYLDNRIHELRMKRNDLMRKHHALHPDCVELWGQICELEETAGFLVELKAQYR